MVRVPMRLVIRYLLACGTVLAVTWGLFGVQVKGRTVFGHMRALGRGPADNVMARIRSASSERIDAWSKPEKKTKKKAARPKRASKHEQRALRLKRASKAMKKRSAKRTRVDERIAPEQEKALDDLLSRRVQQAR